jgi:hypothetical protein
MSRVYRVLTSLIVILTFTVAVAVVQPQPVHADTDTTTILIVVGAVIGGLALFALIMTLLVRNNPAWMPFTQGPDLQRYNRFGGPPPEQGVRFGLACASQKAGLPLVCW